MRRLFPLFMAAVVVAMPLQARQPKAKANGKTASTVRIYINPGHGSWGPNDRPMPTIPYPNLASTGRPDTCGFYESNTDLWKCLELGACLERMGVKHDNIMYSRKANGPFPYKAGASDEHKYNRNLSEICAEVNANNMDMFISIHSNATTDGTLTNYPLILYRGTDASEKVVGSKAMATACWGPHWENTVEYMSLFSKTNSYIKGDITFYNSTSTVGYLGVLKHNTPGFLLEGFFHTYQPARHRAINRDYCRQEGIRVARGVCDYWGLTPEKTGYIMGTIKSASETITNSLFTYKSGSTTVTKDSYMPLNGAKVHLFDSDGKEVAVYQVDNLYNGIFVFSGLTPGKYSFSIEKAGYKSTPVDDVKTVSVTANETAYINLHADKGDDGPAVRDIYAYGLSSSRGDDGAYTFTFSVNENPTETEIIFTDASGKEVGRQTVSAVKGDNSFTIAQADLPGTDGDRLSWAVRVKGKAVTAVRQLYADEAAYTGFLSGMAVDKSPESERFGYAYVGNNVGSGSAANGIYAYDPVLKRLNDSPYRGNAALGDNYRMAVDGAGRLWVTDHAAASSGVYVADPARLSDSGYSFTQFFSGSRGSDGVIANGGVNIGTTANGIALSGGGTNAKLFVANNKWNSASPATDVCVYDIGQADGSLTYTWDKAPSNVLRPGHLYNGNVSVVAGRDGGAWVSQVRASGNNTDYAPSLIYVTRYHTITYSSGTTANRSLFDASGGAGFAVSNDGKTLVINDSKGVLQFLSITWVNDSTPTLTHKDSFESGVAYSTNSRKEIYQMAFDYGGNLYCVGNRLGVFSMPTDDNENTTPARKALKVVKGSLTTDVFIKGPAIDIAGTTGGDASSADGLRLTYDAADECYKYMADGEEKPLRMLPGKKFVFTATDGQSSLWYGEDDTEPVTIGSLMTDYNLKAAYSADGNNDTQFVNYLSSHSGSPQESTDGDHFITWGLANRPSPYESFVRLYVKPGGGSHVFYTVLRKVSFHEFDKAYDLQQQAGEALTFWRSWSDFNACRIPDGVRVFVVSAYDNSNAQDLTTAQVGTVTIQDITALGYIPANCGVLLGCNASAFINGDTKHRVYMEAFTDNPNATLPDTYTSLLTPVMGAADASEYDDTMFPFYYANGHAGFFYPAAGERTTENDCYLRYTGAAAKDGAAGKLAFSFGGNTGGQPTGIEAVEPSQSGEPYFTLSGVRLPSKPKQSGVYVRGGKKVVVK